MFCISYILIVLFICRNDYEQSYRSSDSYEQETRYSDEFDRMKRYYEEKLDRMARKYDSLADNSKQDRESLQKSNFILTFIIYLEIESEANRRIDNIIDKVKLDEVF